MSRIPAVALVALLVGCATTAQVQSACGDVEDVLTSAKPVLGLAPETVKVAATALAVGAMVCGSPEYAAAREGVVAWLKEWKARTP